MKRFLLLFSVILFAISIFAQAQCVEYPSKKNLKILKESCSQQKVNANCCKLKVDDQSKLSCCKPTQQPCKNPKSKEAKPAVKPQPNLIGPIKETPKAPKATPKKPVEYIRKAVLAEI